MDEEDIIKNQMIEVLTLYLRAEDELYSGAFGGKCMVLESTETLKEARALHEKYNPDRKDKWEEDYNYMRQNARILYSKWTKTGYWDTYMGKRYMWATLLKKENDAI